ncbi:hypothetical protein UO65_6257 [Actinokineospora spheciospongiae]|uniref:Uncharacterized protein n=1 Tax=Actinokineospora spheciospongiae TaxID=909613 RepID=W7IC58_9PSEU|nr:hypothetical protein UO65_6257 [Actinokineospora spheciospongiae]
MLGQRRSPPLAGMLDPRLVPDVGSGPWVSSNEHPQGCPQLCTKVRRTSGGTRRGASRYSVVLRHRPGRGSHPRQSGKGQHGNNGRPPPQGAPVRRPGFEPRRPGAYPQQVSRLRRVGSACHSAATHRVVDRQGGRGDLIDQPDREIES